MKQTIKTDHVFGVLHLNQAKLEEYRRNGVMLDVHVWGALIVESGISPDLFKSVVRSLEVTGFVSGWDSILGSHHFGVSHG